MKTLKWSGLLAFSLMLAGCQIAGPDDDRGTDSGTQRAVWEAFSEGTYHFTLMRGCFCIHAGEFSVQVVNGTVTEAIGGFENQRVPSSELQYIESIDDIFDMIEEAERDADELEVDYADNGYPTRVMIDWIEQAVDDEMYLEVSDVVLGVQ